MTARVQIKTGRDKPLRQRHPWIFSGAIEHIDKDAVDGDIIDVVTSRGDFLARGYLNRRSQIVVRLLTWDQSEAIDAAFWARRLARSIRARPNGPARRLINAESDGLPGLIVDQYGDWLVLQSLTLGIEQQKGLISSRVIDIVNCLKLCDKSLNETLEAVVLSIEQALLKLTGQ